MDSKEGAFVVVEGGSERAREVGCVPELVFVAEIQTLNDPERVRTT